MTPQKKKRRKQQAQLAEDMTTGEVRKAIENAKELVDSIGHYAMKFDGTRYTVRLSKRTVGIVAYDAESGEVVIVLPDKTRWQLDVPERFRRNMLIHIKDTEDMFHKQARLDELEGLAGKIWEMASAGRLGDAGVELARENARLSNMIREMGDALQEAASLQNAFDAERRKAVRSKKRAEGAEADKKRAEESLKKADEELARTKSRNSRLAAAANKIKTKKKKPYKKPIAGKKGGRRKPRTVEITRRKKADQTVCHKCDAVLGNVTETRPRIIEDVADGKWEVTRYEVARRWCPGCKGQRTTPVQGALPKQRFGNRVLGMIAFLKMIGVSFNKIRLIFLAFYNVNLSKKTLEEAVRTVSRSMEDMYAAIQKSILKGGSVNGDETSWYVMGVLWWVWIIVGKDAVWFSIQEGRGKKQAKKMLPNYSGTVGSDSLPAWNHVGAQHQKCHLHYSRDMTDTLNENKGAEFRRFEKKLRQILWESHGPVRGRNPDDALPAKKRKRRNLLRRLWYLMDKDYTDADCKRYVKRLYREFYHLFCFVIEDIDWHNNVSESGIRPFTLLRKVMYGNRSEFDHETYAILHSVIGTCLKRGANPLDCIVSTMSRKPGSPVELPPAKANAK